MTTTEWGAIYKELGARPIINAIGSLTLLGGSTPPPEVTDAMEAAASAYVPLTELEERAGAYIAEALNVPAAYVTSGAGSALTLATAAFMAGDDDDRIQQLPDTTGMRNEILIQRRQRYWYDRCLELAGARIVEFGSDDGTTAGDLERAISERTAAVHYYMVEEALDPAALSLEETIRVAKAAGVPVMVDAAGQVYPLDNVGKYVRMGASFQCIAAKYIGAPQSTGLALGDAETIRKLSLQTFVSYEGRRIRGVGRPQKIDRQEIVGVVAAVRRWMTLDHEARLADAERKSDALVERLQGIDGLEARMIDNIVGHHPFGVRIECNPAVAGKGLHAVVDELKAGDPPIWTRVRAGESHMDIHVFGLKDGEAEVVGDRIAALFG